MSESVKVESQDWTPTIERVSFGSDVAQVAEIVDRDGGVILTDVLTREEVDAVNRELEPSMERHAGSALAEVFAGVSATGRKEKEKTGYEGARTRHLQHCVKRSKTYRDKILASEILGEYVEAVVPGCFGRFSCFTSVVIDALPGEIPQNLHRDGFFLFGPYTGHGNDKPLAQCLLQYAPCTDGFDRGNGRHTSHSEKRPLERSIRRRLSGPDDSGGDAGRRDVLL